MKSPPIKKNQILVSARRSKLGDGQQIHARRVDAKNASAVKKRAMSDFKGV